MWIANYRANARGLCLDQDLINACITLADEEDLWIIDYAASLAPGVNLRSTKQVIEWLACEGVHVPNLEKRTLLTTKMPERICEVLKLESSYALTASRSSARCWMCSVRTAGTRQPCVP